MTQEPGTTLLAGLADMEFTQGTPRAACLGRSRVQREARGSPDIQRACSISDTAWLP